MQAYCFYKIAIFKILIENAVTKNKRRLLNTNTINFNSEVSDKSQKGVYLRVKANIQCSSMDRAWIAWISCEIEKSDSVQNVLSQ